MEVTIVIVSIVICCIIIAYLLGKSNAEKETLENQSSDLSRADRVISNAGCEFDRMHKNLRK